MVTSEASITKNLRRGRRRKKMSKIRRVHRNQSPPPLSLFFRRQAMFHVRSKPVEVVQTLGIRLGGGVHLEDSGVAELSRNPEEPVLSELRRRGRRRERGRNRGRSGGGGGGRGHTLFWLRREREGGEPKTGVRGRGGEAIHGFRGEEVEAKEEGDVKASTFHYPKNSTNIQARKFSPMRAGSDGGTF